MVNYSAQCLRVEIKSKRVGPNLVDAGYLQVRARGNGPLVWGSGHVRCSPGAGAGGVAFGSLVTNSLSLKVKRRSGTLERAGWHHRDGRGQLMRTQGNTIVGSDTYTRVVCDREGWRCRGVVYLRADLLSYWARSMQASGSKQSAISVG